MRVMREAALLFLFTVWGTAAAWAQPVEPPGLPVQLRDVKVESRPSGATVTVATTARPKYDATLIDSPFRLVIDLNGTFASPRSRWTPMPDPIKEIRGSQFKPGTARVVIELSRKATYHIEDGPTGLAILIDAPTGAPASNPRPAAATQMTAALPDLPRMPDAPKQSEAPRQSDAPKQSEARKQPDAPKQPDGPKQPEATKQPDAPKLSPRQSDAPKLSDAPKQSEATKQSPRPSDAPKIAAEPKPASTPSADRGPTVTTTVAVAAAAPVPPIRLAQAQSGSATPPPTNGSKLITLEFKDADIINLLRILGAESGRNIVAGDDVKGKISVSLRNVTWEQALDTILEVKGLQKVERGSVIRIVSAEQLAKEREAQARADDAKRRAEIDARTKMAEAELKEAEVSNRKLQAELAAAEAQSRGPLREEVVRLSYANPEEVAKTLQGILGIPPEGAQVSGTPGVAANGGFPPIAEPPFSALYGLGQQQQQRPPQLVSVSQDVLAKGLTITANKATNSIFLRLYASDLERIKKLIREFLDVPLPQVKIEARMEILDRTALESIGIQWGGAGAGNAGKTTLVGQGFQTPFPVGGTGVANVNPINPNLDLSQLLPIAAATALPLGGNLVNLPISALPNSANVVPAGGISFGIVGTNFNINLALQALASQGKTRTLARPEIVTVENNKAEISLGEEIPYATVSSAGTQIQFKEALLKLSTTPTVIRTLADGREDTRIKLVVIVENNSRGDVVNLGQSGSPPAINKRKADTLVLLNEGERLVIGGVTQSVNQNTIRKVPILGDIPFLGWLFKQKENFEQGRELVVFLTPSVLRIAGGQTVTPAPPR